MGDRVNVGPMAKVAASVVGQLRPKWQELTAKASELEAARKAEREARATVDDQNKRLRPIVDALRPLNEGDRKVLASIVADVSKEDSGRPGRERCANETWSDAPPGQTAIGASVDSLVWLRVG